LKPLKPLKTKQKNKPVLPPNGGKLKYEQYEKSHGRSDACCVLQGGSPATHRLSIYAATFKAVSKCISWTTGVFVNKVL